LKIKETSKLKTQDYFNLSGHTAVITGGAGLLGKKHAEALLDFGANCVLADINEILLKQAVETLSFGVTGENRVVGVVTDITKQESVESLLEQSIKKFGSVDILINNAANNPKYENISGQTDLSARFETYPLEMWNKDISVGLTGSFLCSRIIGAYMAQNRRGVILNISSDLGIIAPDQRLYKKDDTSDDMQPTKPVTYSVVKSGLIGLTKYLATYWADKGIRANVLVPGGVYTGQDEVFLKRISNLIPMSRMANPDDYKAAIVFLCSEASAYMTGSALVIDGGRTCW